MWLKEWKKDVKKLEYQVRLIKLRLRDNWDKYPHGTVDAPLYDQWELLKLKYQLTHLYTYRAANRGLVHSPLIPVRGYGLVKPDTSKYDQLKLQAEQLHAQRRSVTQQVALSLLKND